MHHNVEREKQQQQLQATEDPEEAVEPRQLSVGAVGLKEAIEQEAARKEAQASKETVDVVCSGGDVICCNLF